jgi:ABC-2 type transport system ATP-binding protein
VPAVEAEGLVKVFRSRGRDVRALDGVDLAVEEGTVLGLLGPNGAGKTTTVRILATLLRADAGRATVAGHDVVRDAQAVRRTIGLSGQYAAVDENLTARENLWMFGRLYGLAGPEAHRRADELLERFDLVDAADRVAKTYSGGMRRRLDLASALIGQPRLLFLDEPTTGLDPRSRLAMWDVIRTQVREGRPSSSRRSTSRRPTSWPTRSPWSITGASSRVAPRTSSSPRSAGNASRWSPPRTLISRGSLPSSTRMEAERSTSTHAG